MPFGLVQGPAHFTALRQRGPDQFNDFCVLHMYDVLVHDSSESDYLRTFENDPSKDQRRRSKDKTLKICIFQNLQYVGHLISGEDIYPLKEEVEMILNLAPLEM